MMKKIGEFLLAKEMNAIVVAFLAALLPVFSVPTGFIATIIVALVTLQKGPKSGFWVLSWVALPAVSMLFLHRLGMIDVLFFRSLAIWIFASLFYRLRNWSRLLELVAVVCALLIALLHIIKPDIEQWWVTQLTTYIQHVIAASHWRIAVTPSEFAQRLAPMITGVAAFFFASGVLFELMIARWWQTYLVNSGEFGKEFIAIRVERFFALEMVVLLVLMLINIKIATDIFPIVLLPFCVAGLSIVHFYARQKKSLIYFLVVIYVGLIFVPVVIVSILSLLAFIDTWRHFRRSVSATVERNI